MTDFTVIKRDFQGEEVLSYQGTIRERGKKLRLYRCPIRLLKS